MMNEARRTKDDDVEDKNDEADNSTATAVSPGVAVAACAQCLLSHRKGEGEKGEKGELEKHVEFILKICCWCSGSNEEI